MSATTITCPKCKESFEPTEAIAAPIEARLKKQYEAETTKRAAELAAGEQALAAKAAVMARERAAIDESVNARVAAESAKMREEERQKATKAVALEITAAREENAELRKKADAATKRELALAKAERDLAEKESAMALANEATLAKERAKIAEQARKEAAQQQEPTLAALRQRLSTQEEAVKKAEAAELAARKDRAQLEDEKRALQLQVQRTLDEERNKIRSAAAKESDERNQLVLAEKDQQMGEMREQIDALRRKADQASQQAQGEVLEVELERILKDAFPLDLIEPVPKGAFGGDVVQKVRNDLGHICGVILWESKRTKAWQEEWLVKLRDDGRTARADAVALMSVAMPKDCSHIGVFGGVCVCSRQSVIGAATMLRVSIIDLAASQRSLVGQQGKMAAMYRYLTSAEFRQQMTAVVGSISAMEASLHKEKKQALNNFKKREKQIQRAVEGAMAVHGSVQAIAGADVQPLAELDDDESLALEAGEE